MSDLGGFNLYCTEYTPVRKSEGRLSLLLQSISLPLPALSFELRVELDVKHTSTQKMLIKHILEERKYVSGLYGISYSLKMQNIVIIPVLQQCCKQKYTEHSAGNTMLYTHEKAGELKKHKTSLPYLLHPQKR